MLKRREKEIFDKILKQLPPDNDEYFVVYEKDSDSFVVKKESKKKDKNE